ncbi:MAG: hypothetical protein CBB97_24820 [Candidatus Endolissoclinum sp. TMED37]|nr:MAG: hypothetical protein CBB97_24820 [Candidatus Endolissoclinum sp. TMED37]
MATTDRQNRLLVAEDWTKIYQAFQQADFKSYDFETLRRTMVSYIKENYPDDFNDFVESSEYVALIDLIAYVAQSLSFRVDLNARENFLETASRRSSILRLARLINYNAKRNLPATGLLKIDSISTTQDVLDSTGTNLSNQTINWNDSANSNYREQFTSILNAANQTGQLFGKPRESASIGGIQTDIYTLSSNQTDLPIFSFRKSIGGVGRTFEIVPSTIKNSESIYEADPIPGTGLTYTYRSDGSGDSSNNTGFFMLFKQGNIENLDFTQDVAITNFAKAISTANINNNDMWLYKLDQFGQILEKWSKVENKTGNNAIYNSLSKGVRTIYNVVSKADDSVDLVFGDGNFSDIPLGSFRTYYRVSDNAKYSIQPADMQGIGLSIPYIDANGGQQTLNVNVSLKASIYNSAASESNDSIRQKAPQVYYSQDRMITAEDYQVVPLSASQEIIKARSVNRSASGISRAKEILDPSGAYSNVSVFADDGVLYREESIPQFTFTFTNRNTILDTINNKVENKLRNAYARQFYYLKYGVKDLSSLNATWNSTNTSTNTNTGYFTTGSGSLLTGAFATSNLKYAKVGSLIKFLSPDTREFLNDTLVTAGTDNAEDRAWAKVGAVVGDGANGGLGNLEDGNGPITLNDILPNGVKLDKIIPNFTTSFLDTLKNELIDRIEAFETFGIRYDVDSESWKVITSSNLSESNVFSLSNAGSTAGTNSDASWWFNFSNDGNTYTVTYRSLNYIFESPAENKFHFDPQEKIYDYKSGKSVKDVVKVLKTNSILSTGNSIGYPINWQVVDTVTEADGYQDNRKIKIGFFDDDDDGVVDNPDIFDIIVEPNTNEALKYVFWEKYISYNNIERFRTYATTNFIVTKNETDINLSATTYTDGQLFYFYDEDENVIKKYNSTTNTLAITTDYYARRGRGDISFQYKHNAGQETRIDPAVSNIVDIYLLERSYDNSFRIWLQDGGVKPAPSTTDQLRISYSGYLNSRKSLSDQIIYHPVKYKILFGSEAPEVLQATFKVVKNSKTNVTDAIIKTRVISAINEFFALDNWDFGDSFYFTELAAYIHTQLAPDLATVVIVPNQSGQSFGSLFQIECASDEIFISGATVDDVTTITALGANQLAASGAVVTSTSTTSQNTTTGSAVSGSTTSGSGSSTGSSGAGY